MFNWNKALSQKDKFVDTAIQDTNSGMIDWKITQCENSYPRDGEYTSDDGIIFTETRYSGFIPNDFYLSPAGARNPRMELWRISNRQGKRLLKAIAESFYESGVVK